MGWGVPMRRLKKNETKKMRSTKKSDKKSRWRREKKSGPQKKWKNKKNNWSDGGKNWAHRKPDGKKVGGEGIGKHRAEKKTRKKTQKETAADKKNGVRRELLFFTIQNRDGKLKRALSGWRTKFRGKNTLNFYNR